MQHASMGCVFLAGEGPVLSVYSLQPRPEASASLNVLQHCRIHGIRPRSPAAVPAQSSADTAHSQREDGQKSRCFLLLLLTLVLSVVFTKPVEIILKPKADNFCGDLHYKVN